MPSLFTAARKIGSVAGRLFGRKEQTAPVAPKVGSVTPKVTEDDLEAGFRKLRAEIEGGRRAVLKDVGRTFNEPLRQFLAGQFVPVTSSNVESIAYLRETRQCLVLFKNGGMYQYDQVSEAEATAFFEAGSKGGYVWDAFRVKGTVFGHKKPYRYLAAGSHGYAPKYTKRAIWSAEHASIPPSGNTPQSWKEGKGPYPPWYG